MPLTAITIENFKGIREPVRVEFKPITLLFGPNSAGKSTIVQALHYAREIFERQNLNPDRTLLGGNTMDLGGFESLVYQHDLKLPVRLRFEIDLSQEDLPDYKEGYEELESLSLIEGVDDEVEIKNVDFFQDVPSRIKRAEVLLTIRWSTLLDRPLLFSYEISANGEDLAEIRSSEDARQIGLTRLNFMNSLFFAEEEKEILAKHQRQLEEGGDVNEFLSQMANVGLMQRVIWVMNVDKVNPFVLMLGQGISAGIHEQLSPLPHWGKPLAIDLSLWNNEQSTFGEWGFFVKMLSSLIVGPGEIVRDELRKLRYVGPLRVVPKRSHRPATSPEESRWADGLAAYDTLFFADDAFIKKVNEWLTRDERLNSGYKVEVKTYRELETDSPLMLAIRQGRILDEDKDLHDSLLALPVKRRLLIRDEARGIELLPQDIGVGISQVLPVIVAALSARSGFVAVEQPELHIHPAFQVALGDLFIEQIREYPDVIFLLETHSEHIMLRLLRRIRETGEGELPPGAPELTPDSLSIYFAEQGEDGITFSPIRVDREGDFIDRWPRGFFSERVGELY